MAVGTNRDINGNFYYCCRMFTDFLLSCNGKEDDVCLEYIYFVVFYIYDWYFVAGITFSNLQAVKTPGACKGG